MTAQPPSPVRPGARLTRAGVPSPDPTTEEGTTVTPDAIAGIILWAAGVAVWAAVAVWLLAERRRGR